MPRSPTRELLLYLLLLPLLALRHLSLYFTSTEFAHFDHLVWNLSRLEGGTWWVRSPLLWETGLQPGGPIYYWLHLPALLFDHPVVGIHLYYGLLELAAISAFVLIGLRMPGLIPRAAVWAGALLLAGFGDAKLVICENMTIATYLAIPLFMATLWGLRAERARAMALAGLLLGLMVHVHLATLYVLPVLVAAVLLERRRVGARLVWLLAGWAPVAALSLPGILGGPPGGGADLDAALATLSSRFSLQRVGQRLLFVLHDPLSLLGLGLALTAWIRGRAGALERLAVLWILAGYLGLGVALSYMSLNWEESRFATVNPARAVLDAMALLWLGRQAGALLERWRAVKIQPTAALAALALAAILLLGALTWQRRARFEAEYARGLAAPCYCDLWSRETDERYVKRLVDRILAGGVPPLDRERIVVSGPLKERGGALLHWLTRSRREGQRARGLTGTSGNMHAAPLLRGFDLSRPRGARGYGAFALIPGALPVKYTVAGPGKIVVDGLGEVPGDHRLLMVTVHGDTEVEGPRGVTMEMAGALLPGVDSCACEAGDQYRRYADWRLFRLPRMPRPGEQVTLTLTDALSQREALWVVALPPPEAPR